MENNTENNVASIIEENNTGNNMNNTENVGIEDNFEQLEDIISKMQSDRITLEQSFELYNKGLSFVCHIKKSIPCKNPPIFAIYGVCSLLASSIHIIIHCRQIIMY